MRQPAARHEGLEVGRRLGEQLRLAPALEQPPEGCMVEERVARLARQAPLQQQLPRLPWCATLRAAVVAAAHADAAHAAAATAATAADTGTCQRAATHHADAAAGHRVGGVTGGRRGL
jgi:hypothetical protein